MVFLLLGADPAVNMTANSRPQTVKSFLSRAVLLVVEWGESLHLGS